MKCSFCIGRLQSIKSIIIDDTGDVEFYCPLCGRCYDKNYTVLDYKLVKITNPSFLNNDL